MFQNLRTSRRSPLCRFKSASRQTNLCNNLPQKYAMLSCYLHLSKTLFRVNRTFNLRCWGCSHSFTGRMKRTATQRRCTILTVLISRWLCPLDQPPIAQEQLRHYAEASGDVNPNHLDEEAAHRVGLDGVIAHGMLSMAFIGQFVIEQIAGFPGARLERLRVRFMDMVRVG